MPLRIGLFLDAFRSPKVAVICYQREGGESPPRGWHPVKISVRPNLRRQHLILVRNGPHDARPGDPDRPGVNLANLVVASRATAGRGVSVGGVANARAGSVRGQREEDRFPLIKTSRQTEMHRLHTARDGGIAVGRARCRLREIAPLVVFVEPVADTRGLLGILNSRHGPAGRLRAAERQVLAIRVELEVGVRRLGGALVADVLAGGKDDEPFAGADREVGEKPLGQVGPVVRQRPAREVHCGVAAVVQLDPVSVHALVRSGGGGAELADHHVAGGVGRVNLHRPGLAKERVGCPVEIGDAVVVRPGQLHLTRRRLVELKHIRPGTVAAHRLGREAVGHKVARVDALHRLVEPQLHLAEIPRRPGQRQAAGQTGRHEVEQFVTPGGFLDPRISFRGKLVRRRRLVADTVARGPPDVNPPAGRLVEAECERVGFLHQFRCRVVIDHQVIHIHAGHRFAEGDCDRA